jgi:Tfp pilus assembly protein PilO
VTNPFKNVRLNVMLSVAILSGVGGYFFVTTAYTPRREEVAAVLSHEARLVQLNKNNREILVAIGLDKIKEALLRYKEQASHVSALVPSDSAGVTRRSLLDVVTVSAANTGVRLVDSKPLSPGQQSGFATEGFTLTVVGRYHDVGALMTELLSMDRITQLQKIRLHAVPLNATDDLASQSASGAPGAGPTPSALPGTPGQS